MASPGGNREMMPKKSASTIALATPSSFCARQKHLSIGEIGIRGHKFLSGVADTVIEAECAFF
jgi:hypothetical protein